MAEGACVRLSEKFMLNSETRFAATFAARISTSSAFSSHGEASMLRISVETRAFDCE
ncbi:hypothetical protein D3C83_275910 [compost metagenome]